ncbi:MAG: formate dehydrogenase accessory sulfurtransferase FdhD, partial [Chloroflexota bacterium]|nr:formate dehydrogenase accessory sulfurtransferase FdhD [Chloroflexota bacterium]
MTEPPLAQPSRSTADPLRQVTSGVVRWQGGAHADTTDELVAEEPLEIRALSAEATQAPETIAVIMRTPGHDDELAAGFLLSEGLVTRGDARLTPDGVGGEPDHAHPPGQLRQAGLADDLADH